MRGLLVCLVICVSVTATAKAAGGSYLCIGDHAVGFSFDNNSKQWIETSFKPHKYIVRKAKPSEFNNNANNRPNLWIVEEFGEKLPVAFCDDGFNGNLMDCKLFLHFEMNRQNMRFNTWYLTGYVDDLAIDPKSKKWRKAPEGSDTPYMEIGKCSPV